MKLNDDDQTDLAELLDSRTWQIVERLIAGMQDDRAKMVADCVRHGWSDAAFHQGHIDALAELRVKLLKLSGANTNNG